MFTNLIKTAIRSLKKNKGFTAINITGLSIGLATCLLIVLYVIDDLSYDKYNLNSANIYRTDLEVKFGDNKNTYAAVPGPLAQEAKKDFPGVEQSVRLRPAYEEPDGFLVKKGNEVLKEKNVIYADSTLFDVFTFPMIDGDPHKALAIPKSVVITESTAKKYFDRTNVVGETLIFDDTLTYKITGVIKDIPKQSHFTFDFFLSMNSLADTYGGWGGGGFNTYILIKPGADIGMMQKKISQIATTSNGEWLNKNDYLKIIFRPLESIHLQSNLQQELGHNGSIQYVYIFSAIAIFILLIACVNFMNLSTARSANRAREVGVRKVLGSPRKYLIAQFLTESVIVTFVSTVIAIIIVWLTLPLFNQLSGKEVALTPGTFVWLLPLALALVLSVGFIAGSYPAFFLSAFQPIDVLKGKLSRGLKGSGLRSFLVVFQFSISIFLIIGTMVIYNQLHYIQTTNLGYNRQQVLVVKNTDGLKEQAGAFKQQVLQLPGVVTASSTMYTPVAGNVNISRLAPRADMDAKSSMLTEYWPVDADYIKTLGIQVKEGRDFSATMKTDSNSLIINEAAVKFLGLKGPLNKILYRDAYGVGPQSFHIIGIIRDFHFKSLRENITPVVLYLAENHGALNIKVNTANMPALMSDIEHTWKKFAPYQHFDYSFMDAEFDAAYHAEDRVGAICIAFTILAIAIACLGLFGLAAYAAEQRTKEIGIRKVLGADVATLVTMLSKDFIKLVCIAILIASPLAWFAMQKWLGDFAYRVNMQWWVVGIAGFAAILIAFVTVSFQSIKAANANPVKSLKAE